MGSAAKVVAVGDFKRRALLFRVAGVALREYRHMFHSVLEVVVCDTRNTFASFSEDVLHFSCSPQHCEDFHRHFRCAMLCFWRIALSGQQQTMTKCEFCGMPGILTFCEH